MGPGPARLSARAALSCAGGRQFADQCARWLGNLTEVLIVAVDYEAVDDRFEGGGKTGVQPLVAAGEYVASYVLG